MLVDNFSEALKVSYKGWIDDAMSFTAAWGFRVEEILPPVLLWHGELDVFSPVAHTRWLADRIPGASLIQDGNSAHFGAMAVLPRVLNWLAQEGQPGRPAAA
jgi:pimeloyl-ACP methyl ester carboxylesterase